MSTVEFGNAVVEDLPEIIFLLADDELGKSRELTASDPVYLDVFQEISADPNNELIVGKADGRVVAVLQVTYIPTLVQGGAKRALIEGVRVSSTMRGQGVGKKLFSYVLARAKGKGCKLAQLTTNKARSETGTFQFYETLGFKATHEGYKLWL